MAKIIKPTSLADALQQELRLYSQDVTDRVNLAGRAASKKLLKLTKANAPVASGSFRKNIAVKEVKNAATGDSTFIWYVKPPDHRVTHLLVHGHATRNGGRTKSDPFLKNALEQVLPEYEATIKEELQK